MRNIGTLAALVACTPVAAAAPMPAAGGPINANMGPVIGSGLLTDDREKEIGTWSISARLVGGHFSGTGTITINSQSVSAELRSERSYLENNRCVLYWEDGRARAEIAGPCTTNGIGGVLSAFIPAGEIFSVNGYASGQLIWGNTGRAPTSGIVPTAHLTCAYMDRIGGNVAGDGSATYELRYSNMGFLQLMPNATYRTTHTVGHWTRGSSNIIRLVTGQFAGAVGRLGPDKSGTPAVYFELSENKDTGNVPIVDVYRTSCTAKR